MAKDTSTNLTLRFKHGNITVLVFADELEPFSKIKEDLLEILREVHPQGLMPPPESSNLQRIPIPDSVDEVLLATPKNPNDPSEGWEEIDTTSETGAKDCPKSLGVKEADMLAFVLTGSSKKPEFWATFSDPDELYPEEAEDAMDEDQ